MQIRYCIKCGVLMNLKDEEKPKDLCESCEAGKKPSYRGARDSSMISRKKIEAAQEAHKHRQKKKT